MITQIEKFNELVVAANSKSMVAGLTHDFYRYPARFAPEFARKSIELFSKPGDLVLDPFMGGATTIVEAVSCGRSAFGSDINSLAIFLAKVKTSVLPKTKQTFVLAWLKEQVDTINVRSADKCNFDLDVRTKNLQLPRARFVRKFVGLMLNNLDELPSESTRSFARCVLLRTCQWALDGKKKSATLPEFKSKLLRNASSMSDSMNHLRELTSSTTYDDVVCKFAELPAANIDQVKFLQQNKANLVVCSPPYPGVHVLYHRWQVDGRRETPAPYWIADCQDGHGEAYYTFGNRQQKHLTDYFENALQSFSSIRKVVSHDAIVVQMIAFTKPESHLRRYLKVLETAGFKEVGLEMSSRRIWRTVPNRKWHANLNGNTSSSREVVLIHRAA